MRIAFVGKGGSGKSTLCASFALYLSKQTNKQLAIFDADLNIHAPELLGFPAIPKDKHISAPKPSGEIKKWLIGENDIKNLGAFRKTTPPTRKSNTIQIEKIKETPIAKYGEHKENISVFAVGTYQEEELGSACYHTNLAVFENILSHTDDINGYIIADMVAGVDSFAGTLHAQFDLTCLIVEPTMRSIEVYIKYISLAESASIANTVKVIGNKIRNLKDVDFIKKHIPEGKIIGFFSDDEHIREIDQENTPITLDKLNKPNIETLKAIFENLNSLPNQINERLVKLRDLHKKYVTQSFIKERFGDLTGQIDTEFIFKDDSKK